MSYDLLAQCTRGIVVLDGATGTELAKQGLPGGVCPEEWVLAHPESIQAVQQAYEAAGSDIVYSCTFGGNRVKLGNYGLTSKTIEINRRLAEISRSGIRQAHVFGDMAPTGKFVEPFGPLLFEEAIDIYKEQARGLLEGGVEGFAIETMMDLQEARAALIAVRELSDLPVIVTLTFEPGGRTLTGTCPEAAMITLQALGATAVGCNCSAGPEQMASVVAAMKKVARIPVVAKPNAGMPRYLDGHTVFDMNGADFGQQAALLVQQGASIIGGCCGTTPEHIGALKQQVENGAVPKVNCSESYVCSTSQIIHLSADEPFCIIGERLNPTGKKALQAELREGKLDLVRKYAREQKEAGAGILDVNCGLSGIDESAVIRQVTSLVSSETGLPLCIDTVSPAAAEAALRLYPGRALFNSISAESSRLEQVLPIVAKYGAAIVALPLNDDGIPDTVAQRAQLIQAIADKAMSLGYQKTDLIVDGLVMTVSANPAAAQLTLDTIEWVARVWKGCTVCGLSNVSFGLPRREFINQCFLSAAISRGLNMAIANPMSSGIMETVRSANVLFQKDAQAVNYIQAYSNTTPMDGKPAEPTSLPPSQRAFQGVVKGDTAMAMSAIEELLSQGTSAGTIVNDALIPAITAVGEKYEKKEYFLPQLMMGAQTMTNAMERLSPLLEGDSGTPTAGRIILATVKGDIHDIGKNIVALMLKNYGFQVIDLGKDVPAEVILEAAIQHQVTIIGLSALMTTTMGEMKHVVELARQKGYTHLRFIVGGAVVDEDFATSIGALYSRDAMNTVRIAQNLKQQ